MNGINRLKISQQKLLLNVNKNITNIANKNITNNVNKNISTHNLTKSNFNNINTSNSLNKARILQNTTNSQISSINFNFFIKKNIDNIHMYQYTAVIIEPRKHKALEFVLNNFLENLDTRWYFIIFCSDFNYDFINEIISKLNEINQNRIQIIRFIENNITHKNYSELILKTNIHDYIKTEMFLIFQTDTLILNKEKIYDFMNYDYVGAPFNRNFNWRRNYPLTDFYDVGNGGLSLRKKSKMSEILKNNKMKNENEDTYFAYYTNINKPPTIKAQEFSIESTFYDKPFGIHKIWSYLSNDELKKLIDLYPQIQTLIDLQDVY